MAKSKVSVIIPVYNVASYIERCARSLFGQTLREMEFIFVDDSSPDRSIQIVREVLKEFPHRVHQVKFLRHEQNKGLPSARNTGIEAATERGNIFVIVIVMIGSSLICMNVYMMRLNQLTVIFVGVIFICIKRSLLNIAVR